MKPRLRAFIVLAFFGVYIPARATVRFVADTGNTTTNGTNLRTALTATTCGDTVTLQVGITYFTAGGNFTLTNLVGCTTPTTICTGTAGGCVTTNLPAYGSRIIPGTHAQYMAKVTTDNLPALAVASGAHYWTILGLDISDSYAGINLQPSASVSSLIDIGRNDTYADFLTLGHFLLDRCFIHPSDITASQLTNLPGGNVVEVHIAIAIAVSGANNTIIGNDIRGFGGYQNGNGAFRPNYAYLLNDRISDGTNLQKVTTAGTSAGSAPSWNATLNGFTTSGGAIFQNIGGGTLLRAQSYGITQNLGDSALFENNYIEAMFTNIFIVGSGLDPAHEATISSPTATSATLSTVLGLSVGDLIALQYGGPNANNCVTMPPPFCYQVAKIATISGNDITYTGATINKLDQGHAPDNGGDARWKGLLVSNVTVTHNSMYKLPAWQAAPFAINGAGSSKGSIEIKQCLNCLVQGNIMYGACGSNVNLETQGTGTNGTTPWSTIKNMTVRSNLFQGDGGMWTLQGNDGANPSTPSDTILVTNNLVQSFPQTCAGSPAGQEYATTSTAASNITYTHNTLRTSTSYFNYLVRGNGSTADDTGGVNGQLVGATNFIFKDNITAFGYYGLGALVAGVSDCEIAKTYAWHPSGTVESNNVIIRIPGEVGDPTAPCQFSHSNVVANDAAVGFVNIAASDGGGDYHLAALASNSTYKGTASDGTDPGVNFNALDSALGPLATGNIPGTPKGWLAGH